MSFSGQPIVLKNLRRIPPNTAKVIRLQKQFVEAVQRYQVSLSLICFYFNYFRCSGLHVCTMLGGRVCVCNSAVRRIFFPLLSPYVYICSFGLVMFNSAQAHYFPYISHRRYTVILRMNTVNNCLPMWASWNDNKQRPRSAQHFSLTHSEFSLEDLLYISQRYQLFIT